jgi:hypothetical protein
MHFDRRIYHNLFYTLKSAIWILGYYIDKVSDTCMIPRRRPSGNAHDDLRLMWSYHRPTYVLIVVCTLFKTENVLFVDRLPV